MAIFHPVSPDPASIPTSALIDRTRSVGSNYWAARLASVGALVTADLLAFAASLTLAFMVSASSATWLGLEPDFADAAALRTMVTIDAALLAGTLLYLAGQGHYSNRTPFWTEMGTVVTASFAALIANGFVQYSLQRHDSRLLLLLTWALFPVAAVTLRNVARRCLAALGLWQLRVVIVGDPDTARRAARALTAEPLLGYEVVAMLSLPPSDTQPGPGVWRDLLQRSQAEMLVLAHHGSSGLTESLVRDRIPFAVVPPLSGLPVRGFEQTSFLNQDTVLFTFGNNLAEPVARTVKLVFDVLAALAMLLVLLPVLAVIAALVALDGGPVLYAHTRIGARGRPFPCLKFRSMVPGGDAVLIDVLRTDPAAAVEWAATHKLRQDPRITWIGSFLRKTSLDELPQLFNVLRLEMSLVGPRPIVAAEVPRYGDDIAYYYATRPGLTGLWQVSGRSDTGYAQRVWLDTWYVKNWSIWHDMAILVKTVPAVLKRRGAV